MAKQLTDEEKRKADQDDKNQQGMHHALSASKEKGGAKRVPLYGGPKMAPGNKRVPPKKK